MKCTQMQELRIPQPAQRTALSLLSTLFKESAVSHTRFQSQKYCIEQLKLDNTYIAGIGMPLARIRNDFVAVREFRGPVSM
jgi:hypothetical protein